LLPIRPKYGRFWYLFYRFCYGIRNTNRLGSRHS
jgi:hypothetical protein